MSTPVGRMRALSVVMALTALAACRSAAPAGSPSYEDGYRDGCNSGYADAFRPHHEHAFRLDQARFNNEPDYARGWKAAYTTCYREERDFPHAESGNNPN